MPEPRNGADKGKGKDEGSSGKGGRTPTVAANSERKPGRGLFEECARAFERAERVEREAARVLAEAEATAASARERWAAMGTDLVNSRAGRARMRGEQEKAQQLVIALASSERHAVDAFNKATSRVTSGHRRQEHARNDVVEGRKTEGAGATDNCDGGGWGGLTTGASYTSGN